MKKSEINIRDPFVLYENGKYYLYGTRADNFGRKTKGFDVYISDNLENWSEPIECFNSEEHSLNLEVNWAPEVHKYKDSYYMFATFTKESNNLRGTFILKSESPLGPFVPHSKGAVTPEDWECLDGTLYINREGRPYIVFCHEHTQIIDGTICFAQLNDELTESITEPVTLFAASECPWIDTHDRSGHFITDGPFMYRTKTDELLMLWSSFIKGQYAELLVKFDSGEIGTDFTHLEPLIDNDGGHGMIFKGEDKLYLTFHSPNQSGFEKPCFVEIEDRGNTVSVK